MPLSLERCAVAAACVVMLGAASRAAAEPSAEPSVALLAGYARELSAEPIPYYRVGLGVRGGFNVGYLYAGASLLWHFGESQRASGEGNSYDAGFHAACLGGELGLSLTPGRFVLRPYAGVGWLALRGHTTVRGVTRRDDVDALFVAPGVVGLYRVARYFFGLDARIVMAPSQAVERWAAGGLAVVGASL